MGGVAGFFSALTPVPSPARGRGGTPVALPACSPSPRAERGLGGEADEFGVAALQWNGSVVPLSGGGWGVRLMNLG
jgi:hypothetical protein